MAGYPPLPPYTPPTGAPYGFDARQQRQLVKGQIRTQKAAFRAQRDLYRQQARAMRRTSILGPLVIVAIGVLALLIRSGRLPFTTFAIWYGHWWPILLIAAGVIMIIEWSFDQVGSKTGTPGVRRGVGGGVIFLLLVLALTGALFSGVHDGNEFFIHGISVNPDNVQEFFGEKHELAPQIVDQPFAAGTSLSIDNPHGDISIIGKSDDGNIHITVNKQVYANSDSNVEAKGEQLNPRIQLSGGILTISVPSVNGATSDVMLVLPETAPSTVNSNHGAVSITGMKAPVNITSNHGDIELNQIGATVSARANHSGSSFSAHNVTGDISLKGKVQDVNVTDVGGQVSLEGDFFGDTHLEHLHGPLTFQTSRTHFTVARLDGQMDISRSDLSGSQMVGPTQLNGRSRNINLERIIGDLELTNSNGSVDVTSASPVGNITIDNTNGAVNLTVPEKAGLSVEVETNGGDVENDLALSSSKSGDRTTVLGTVGNGSAKIRIHTSHADINIHKGDIQPPTAPVLAEPPAALPPSALRPVKPATATKSTRTTKPTTPTTPTTRTTPSTPTIPTTSTTPSSLL